MNKTNLNDDLKKLRVRKVGIGRATLSDSAVILDKDVREVFQDSTAVNEALRFLIRITQENKSELLQK